MRRTPPPVRAPTAPPSVQVPSAVPADELATLHLPSSSGRRAQGQPRQEIQEDTPSRDPAGDSTNLPDVQASASTPRNVSLVDASALAAMIAQAARQLSSSPDESSYTVRPTPSNDNQGREKLKLGDLSSQHPNAFLAEVRGMQGLYSERQLRSAIVQTLSKSEDEAVRVWYRATLAGLSTSQILSTDEWIDRIRQKFGKDFYQIRSLLDSHKYSPRESISTFVSRTQEICLECEYYEPHQQIGEIVARLPAEYRYGLSFTSFTSVEQLERELVSREEAQHPERARYRARSVSPDTTRKSSVNPGRPRPIPPCPNCGQSHWLKGPQATPCHAAKVKEETKQPRTNSRPAKTYVTTEASSGETESSQGEISDDREVIHLVRPSSGDSPLTPIDIDQPGEKAFAVLLSDTPGPVVWPKAKGPLPSAESFRRLSPARAKVQLERGGSIVWAVMDTGSAMSLVSADYYYGYLQKFSVANKKSVPHVLHGVVPGASTESSEGCIASLLLPLRNGRLVGLSTYLHVVPNLGVSLILGTDTLEPYGIRLDLAQGSYIVTEARNWMGDLLVARDGSNKLDREPVSAPRSIRLNPGQEVEVFTNVSLRKRRFRPSHDSVTARTHQGRLYLVTTKKLAYSKGALLGYAESEGAFP
ncbi:hypothetical protein PYCC9005_001502 [Savitreella phatthalungensis]